MTTWSWWGAELLDHGPAPAVWAHGPVSSVTYGRLRTEVDRLARTLRGHGIRAGHTVALHGALSYTQLWAVFALWSLGAQVVLFEPRLRPGERSALLELCRPQFVVRFGGLGARPDVFVDECEVAVRRAPDGRPATTNHCVVLFSSGTTGRPKAVGRTSESLLVELDRLRGLDGATRPGERVAVLESISHSFGFIAGLLFAMDVGASVVLPATQAPGSIAGAAARADVILGSPRHFEQLLDAGGPSRPRPRLAVSGGEVLYPDVAAEFRNRFGIAIGQAYGTTETGIIAADFPGRHGPPAIGRPVNGVRTRIRDGVLEVHVPQSPYLYQDAPWLGGWMSTHDMATVDPGTGVLRLRGRVDGESPGRVDLLAIESVLRAHTGVTDAIVLGAEPLEAHVATRTPLDQRELRSWCRRFLPDLPAPTRFHIVGHLPRTANGKVVRDRTALREHRQRRHDTDLSYRER